jgi:DnaK suppressor protein
MDIFDRAQENDQFFREQALRAHFMKQIDEPLYNEEGKRICRDCKTRIPQVRLKAMPDTLRCIDCQKKEERRCRC